MMRGYSKAYSKAGLHIGSQPAMVTAVVTCGRHSHPHCDYDWHSSCDCHGRCDFGKGGPDGL